MLIDIRKLPRQGAPVILRIAFLVDEDDTVRPRGMSKCGIVTMPYVAIVGEEFGLSGWAGRIAGGWLMRNN